MASEHPGGYFLLIHGDEDRLIAEDICDLVESHYRVTAITDAYTVATYIGKVEQARSAALAEVEQLRARLAVTDEMIERGAEKIDDLLTMLGVDPGYAPDHAPLDTAKRTLSRAVLRAALEVPDGR